MRDLVNGRGRQGGIEIGNKFNFLKNVVMWVRPFDFARPIITDAVVFAV